jgi:phage terminase large subunit-like protein
MRCIPSRSMYGETHPVYRVRVLGEFVDLSEGSLLDSEELAVAKMRSAPTASLEHIVIGVDPAGERGTGDDSAFVMRQRQSRASDRSTARAHG